MSKLDEIEAELKAATPGPWQIGTAADGSGDTGILAEIHGCASVIAEVFAQVDSSGRNSVRCLNTALLIAHAPDTVAYLLRLARAGEAQRDELASLRQRLVITDEKELTGGGFGVDITRHQPWMELPHLYPDEERVLRWTPYIFELRQRMEDMERALQNIINIEGARRAASLDELRDWLAYAIDKHESERPPAMQVPEFAEWVREGAHERFRRYADVVITVLKEKGLL